MATDSAVSEAADPVLPEAAACWETTGSGFDKSGRPAMLFEPHVFYRNLSGKRCDSAVKQRIAYATSAEVYFIRALLRI